MLDFEKEESEESRLEAYQRKVLERKQNKALEIVSYSDKNSSNGNEFYAEQESSVEKLNLSFSIDDKIDSICLIDKEYQDTLKLAKLSEERAQKVKKEAEYASTLSAGIGKKRKAIEALQKSQIEQAASIGMNTQAITKIAMLQERIIEATKALFTLGVSNVVANRTVYRQLEMKMKGASEEELSDFAKNEVLAVMQQLNEQQDIMARHNKLSEKVHECEAEIESLKLQSKNWNVEIGKLKQQVEKQKEEDDDDSEPDEKSSDKKTFTADEEINEDTEQKKEKKRWWPKKS